MPDNDICTRNKSRNIKYQINEMKILREIVGKTKINGIRSQQIRVSRGIQPLNEWMKR